MKTQSRELTEGLAWMRAQLEPLAGEEVVAGQMFRPRGAWGDEPRRFRRFLWRNLGVARGPLHPLERQMSLIDFAAVTPSRLVLFRNRGAWASLTPCAAIADWPLETVAVRWRRKNAVAEHFTSAGGGFFDSSRYVTRLLVATVEVDGNEPLELDFPAGKVTSWLRAALKR